FLLVNDRIDGNGGLPGLAVADDQLPLAAADGRHGVDGLDTRLERLVHRLSARDAPGGRFNGAGQPRYNRPLAVPRVGEGTDHAADHGVADGHAQQLARGADLVALADLQVLAEDDNADRILFEIESDAADLGAAELHHLAGHDPGEAVDAGDAVAHLQHP